MVEIYVIYLIVILCTIIKLSDKTRKKEADLNFLLQVRRRITSFIIADAM